MNPDDILQSVREVVLLDSEGNRITTTNPILAGFGDSPSLDAFGRNRISDLAGLFDSQLQYDNQRLLWEDKITSNSGLATGTHLPNTSAYQMLIGPDDEFIRQTRAYQRYQPGKSQFILGTYYGMTPDDNVVYEVGYYDGDNGIFFELDGSTASFVLRSKSTGAVVNTRINQTNWKLDTLDGSGSSGKTLDVTKSQIFVADLEWLGVGRVRVGFVIDGLIIYCHEFLNSNVTAHTYMTTANLPFRYRITAGVGLTGTASLTAVCTAIASEGGFESERGVLFSASNETTLISVTTRRPVLSIRPKATFNGITNRGRIEIEEIDIYSQDEDIFYEIVYGGTLTNASFASIDDDSITEQDVSATAISGGISSRKKYLPAGGQGVADRSGSTGGNFLSKLPITLDIDGNHPTAPFTDIITIVATSIPGTATDVGAAIELREVR